MTGTEIVLARPIPTHGLEDRKEAQHLAEMQAAFTLAFHNSRSLGREMLEQMENMDAAKRELEKHGIYIAVKFRAELQAAYKSLRHLLDTPEFDVPDFMKKD